MATSGAADGAAERRARVWSLAALAALLPLAFAVASWRSVKDVFWAEELRPVEVASGASASYAGARWRLAAFKIVTGEKGDRRLLLPQDRALALVRLEAEIERDVDELGWIGCALDVVDGGGRRWKPLFLALSRDAEKLIEPDAQETQGCAGASLAKKTKGVKLLVEEKFLIARDAVPTLTPSFSVARSRPEALRFQGTPERQ